MNMYITYYVIISQKAKLIRLHLAKILLARSCCS